MRPLHRVVLVLAAFLPSGAHSATLEVLSASRMVWAAAYATDDVDEQTVVDSVSTYETTPFDEIVTVELSFGTNVLTALSQQTSSIASAAIHATGRHDAFAENPGVAGFGVANGLSQMRVDFRLDAPDSYILVGFLEAADLGWTTLALSGPGSTIHSFLANSQNLPVSESGTLTAGDYIFAVSSTGSAHGWPPFPSHSSGAFAIDFVLGGATSAEPGEGRTARAGAAVTAFPNPFRHTTRITVSGSAGGPLHLYDTGGRLVRKLRGDAATTTWDGRDEQGATVPSGVYFLRVGASTAADGGEWEGVEGDAVRIVRVR